MFLKKSALIHALVWVILMVLMVLLQSRNFGWSALIVVVPFGFVNIGVFYAQYRWIAPLIMAGNQYANAFLKLLLILITSILIKYGIALQFEDLILKFGVDKQERFTIWQYFFSAGIISFFFALISTMLYILLTSFRQQQVRKNLETEKLNAELAFLKFQINPHFLFNSLNNIYALAYKKSPKTPEAILKLSEMMRYMLYESNDERVFLANEIQYLMNYIELQRLRYKEEITIVWGLDLEEDDKYAYKVMPLLLISFLENAFKHGVSNNPEKPIRVKLSIDQNRLHYRVENTKNLAYKDLTRGVGLDNLKRRLELGYPDQHTLQITESETDYTGELFIYL